MANDSSSNENMENIGVGFFPHTGHHGWGSLNIPVDKSKLIINGGDIVIQSARQVPNAWIRFWHRALLGWRWEDLSNGN